MDISATPVPDKRSGFSSDHVELSEAYDEDTEQVLNFFIPTVHPVLERTIREIIMSPRATKAGFICSSDVIYTNVSRDQYIDLTGTVIPHLRLSTMLDFALIPIGSPEARNVGLENVKLVILFGSRDWNEDVRSRCLSLGVDLKFYESLLDNQDDLLDSLKDVPVIGGEPTHPELSVGPRGYFLVGKKIVVHTKLIEDREKSGQVLHELRSEVDRSAESFSQHRLLGFVFGAFGSLLRHKRHYLNVSAWKKLQNAFPYVQFTGCSTLSVFGDKEPFNAVPNKTLVSIVIFEM